MAEILNSAEWTWTVDSFTMKVGTNDVWELLELPLFLPNLPVRIWDLDFLCAWVLLHCLTCLGVNVLSLDLICVLANVAGVGDGVTLSVTGSLE